MTRYLGGLITADETKTIPADNFEDTSAPGIWTLSEAEMLNKQNLWPTAGVENPSKFVENVFGVDTYVGNGSARTITTGIDTLNEGGLVWIKNRTSAENNFLCDTVRGAPNHLFSNTTAGQASFNNSFGAFTSTGFTLAGAADVVNSSGNNKDYVAWTFRKAPKFFDVVQYSGTGSEQSIAHNLGQVPGMIIHKRTDTNEDWRVYHRMANGGSSPENYIIQLNGEDDFSNDTTNFGAPSSTHFTVKTSSGTNNGSGTYIAYLFGHDTSSDGMIQCGSYTGNASNPGPSVTLGFEPQWLLVKQASGGNNDWFIWDTLRGLPASVSNSSASLNPNTTDTETTEYGTAPTATGFQLQDNNAAINTNGATYIYVAIRRGPMATPTSRAGVFDIDTQGSTGDGKAPAFRFGSYVDMQISRVVTSTASNFLSTRLIGSNYLDTNDDHVLAINTGIKWDYNNGVETDTTSNSNNYSWMWKRAPGFFDVVAYTGNGSNRTISHNLGVVPEMIWFKNRSDTENWAVYYGDATDYLRLNQAFATADDNTYWNDTAPTSTVFTVGTNDAVNTNTENHLALLFATLAGISKVGTFSHTNGSSTDVDCGFSSGSKFVLVKRTDSTGSWYLWDSSRGIVSGNDPYILLDSNATQDSSYDYIDTLSSGFQMSSSFTTGTYIFYAIAS
tara:strand:+ start:437 stop:2452 length:2016 start_codon:yes stop_codon:yes gene_type:complete